MTLDNDQRILLETISAHDGEWNWYKVSRRCIGLLSSPAELTFSPLFESGWIEERVVDGEPLPRLYLTELGKVVLSQVASK